MARALDKVTRDMGKPITVFKGFRIHAKVNKPKGGGRSRLWIVIKQDEPRRWRVYENLSYARAVHVQFEEEPRS